MGWYYVGRSQPDATLKEFYELYANAMNAVRRFNDSLDQEDEHRNELSEDIGHDFVVEMLTSSSERYDIHDQWGNGDFTSPQLAEFLGLEKDYRFTHAFLKQKFGEMFRYALWKNH